MNCVRCTSTRTAFTLMEMLVVIALVALLASLTVPRLLGGDRRAATLAIEQTADLLSLFAHRDSIGERNLRLEYYPDQRMLALATIRPDLLDDERRDAWQIDLHATPVELPEGLELTEVFLDDFSIDPVSPWSIALEDGRVRPRIELVLATDLVAVRVILPPYSNTAQVYYPDDYQNASRVPQDLDAQGRDRERW